MSSTYGSRKRPSTNASGQSPFDLLAAAEKVANANAGATPVVPRSATPQLGDDVILDARGYRRPDQTFGWYHEGREPENKGKVYKANPPTVAECMAILNACRPTTYGRRDYAATMLCWQGALRAFEMLALTEQDLDEQSGAIHIQHGKGDKAATIKMAAWAWPYLAEWRKIRRTLPNPRGPLVCVIDGPTAGRAWKYSDFNKRVKIVADLAGVTKRMSPHQFRHAWAVQAYQAGMPLRAIQIMLRHENIGITDTYLQGLGISESQQQVYDQPVPVIPATVLLELGAPR